jgi:small subunit ribosomal protein S1
VALDSEIDGMVHLSDVSWEGGNEETLKTFEKGKTVKVKILEMDPEKERVALGIKQLSADPYNGKGPTSKPASSAKSSSSSSAAAPSGAKGLSKGAVVTCTVTEITTGGIEVKVEDTKGFIKKADLSRERSEQRPDRFAVGEKVDAKITAIDAKGKISLSIKAREIDEDKQAMQEFGSSDSGASLGDILGAALNKDKDAGEDATEKPKKKAAPKKKKADEE